MPRVGLEPRIKHICPGCGNEIDLDCCGCGASYDDHLYNWGHDHNFIPMGCDCARAILRELQH